MLAAITEILRQSKLLGAGDEPGYNISHVAGYTGNIGAFTRSGASFHIRLKPRGTLPAEYENFCSAWRSFPNYVPEPLGRYYRDDWEVFVVRGIPHRPVFAGNLAEDKRGLVRKISGFLTASNQGARPVGQPESHRTFLRQVQGRLTDPACAGILKKWIADERLNDLPHIRQHGDFVLNNLGLTGSGLVVFDWEDFGRVTFPGLDLCTLLMADAGFNAEKLRVVISEGRRAPRHYMKLLEESCPAIGLTPELFRQLIPLYLVIFLDLKSGYGKAIGATVTGIIRELSGPATQSLL